MPGSYAHAMGTVLPFLALRGQEAFDYLESTPFLYLFTTDKRAAIKENNHQTQRGILD